ncbi:MAG TPA: hypothetical protein VFZ53_29320 [Polyangiaceae bacterium]
MPAGGVRGPACTKLWAPAVRHRACTIDGVRGIEDPEGRCDVELELVRPLGKVFSRAFDPVSLLSRGARGFLVLNWMRLEPLTVSKDGRREEGASVVELSSTGAPTRQCFATSTGSSGSKTGIRDGALDAQGRLALAGWVRGSGLDFGGESIAAPKGHRGSYLAVLTDSWKHAFSNALGGATQNDATSVAFDAHGNVAVAGIFVGKFKLGDAELSAHDAAALYVAKFDAGGRLAWVHVSPFSGRGVGPAVTFTDGGNVLVAGGYDQHLDFGTPLPAAAPLDLTGCSPEEQATRKRLRMFLVELDASGRQVRAESFGDPYAAASDAATSPEGDLVATGMFRGRLALTGVPLEAPAPRGACGCDIDCALPAVHFVARWDRQRKLAFRETLPGATIVRATPGPVRSTVVEQGIPVSFRNAWGLRFADDYRWQLDLRSPSGRPAWSRSFEKLDLKASATVGAERIAVLLHDPESSVLYLSIYRRRLTPP